MTVDALTVDSGVTLNLAGYKLYCSSVAGSGTVTSTYEDLTKPATEGGTFTMVSPSETYAGTVTNLFSNNFTYKQDTVCRLLLKSASANQNLPLIIDYDFGEGNARVVNKYIVYVGTAGRAPKAWVLYGSNAPSAYNNASDDGWVAIDDARTNETGWTGAAKDKPADSRSYDCENTTAYRYYRLKITATNDSTRNDKYLELVQLEYFDTNIAAGELHIDVASGTATWPSSITFSGNVKVVKEGAGTLAKSSDFYMKEGSLVIKSGAVTINGRILIGSEAGKTAAVQIDDGTLTVNGSSNYPALIIGNNSTGVLTINGGMVTVASNKDTYLGYENDSDGTLNLNGGTLTTRRIIKYNGSGVVNFNGGTLKANATVQLNGLINASAVVNVGEKGGTIDSGNLSDETASDKSRVFVAANIGGTGAIRFKGGKTINIEGGVNCAGGAIVELGTKLVAANETAKTSLLAGLAVDGITYTEGTPDIPVFQYTSDLTDPDDRAHVSFLNCGEGTAAEISGAQILVDFVAPAWELDADHLTWSSLVAKYGAPASDARVIIKTDTAYTLTVDTDATVGSIAFTGSGASGSTLSIPSDATLNVTGDITGIGTLSNSGTIVSDGNAALPIDCASTGTLVVNSGTLKVASRTGTGTRYTVRVKGGATFDLNGVGDVTVNVILEEGAFFVNTGSDIGVNTAQTVSITLEGNATVSTTSGDFGLIGPSYGETALYLGAYTLTISGSKTFRLCKTTITGAGTINVVGGTLTQRGTTSGDAGKQSSTGVDCTLVIGSGTTLTIGACQTLTVKNFTNTGTINTSQNGTLTVTGTLTPGNAIKNLTLAKGSTDKATGTAQTVSTTFSATGAITVDASEID
ncbi:MAG: hypothetical protein J6V72_11350, partial [Kiritimatiellae bacterium]|nr:hypothetical protein [Kiritimatiellia bacterium]